MYVDKPEYRQYYVRIVRMGTNMDFMAADIWMIETYLPHATVVITESERRVTEKSSSFEFSFIQASQVTG